MKKIVILVLSVLFYHQSYSQTYPINQTIGATNTLVTSKGGFKSDSTLVIPSFADTSKANLSPYGKNYAGAIIRVVDSLFMRNSTAKKWLKINNTGGSSGTVISVATGYGLSGGTITTTGTLVADTTTGGLSGKYLRIVDTTNKFVNNVTKKNDTTITVFKGPNATDIVLPYGNIYTQSPIMSTVSNDSNIVYFNADTANAWRGNGTVKSVATGYGLSGGTITSTGTLVADTTTGGLSGKYLRIVDAKSGTVTSVATGYGLSGGTITSTGTLLVDSATLSSKYQVKSVAAFTFPANNTSSAANMTDQVFRDSGTLTYSGTITWTGTTPPSGATNHRYRWCQIGKQIVITISINYASGGSALTAVKLTLPVGCPAPTNFGTLTGANDVLGSAWAFLSTSTTAATTGRVLLQNNASNNGFEFNISAASGSYRVAGFTLTYFTD